MQKRTFASIKKEYITNENPIFLNFFEQGYSTDVWFQYHDTIEIGICLKGNGVYFIEDTTIPFSQGSIFIILPGVLHRACSAAESPSEWAFIFFDPNDIGIDPIIKESVAFHEKNTLRLLKVIIDELDNKRDGYLQRAKLLLQAFFLRINTVLPTVASALPIANSLSTLNTAINYISENYNKEISLEDLANVCHFTVGYLSHAFKSAIGISPQKYINNFRIIMSEQLLISTDKPIINIAYEVGFTSLSSFNRTFKAKNGISPREYRNKYMD